MNARSELFTAVVHNRSALVMVGALTALLNVLLLGGSIYMMLVYDSVLPSHSLPTLLFLFGGITTVYFFQAIFDAVRNGILTDIGCHVDEELSPRVQQVMGARSLAGVGIDGDGLTPMRDLDQIRTFLSSAAPAAFFDLPWIIFFLGILTLLHVWLGVAALAGAVILVGLAYLTHRNTVEPSRQVASVTAARFAAAERIVHHAETVAALGMVERTRQRFHVIHETYLNSQDRLARVAALFGGGSKTFRMFLQSGVLTVGAALVISGEASGGVIFASSILSGRALAPIDSAIANWRNFAATRGAWHRLAALLDAYPPERHVALSLPCPRETLTVGALHVAPPGANRLVLANIDFELNAGDILGVVGPSGSGKSSLGRALLGLWNPARGFVRYDGASPDQWSRDRIGAALGYLPQAVELFDGTIAANIARFDPNARSEQVIAAAKLAGVHELIVSLPDGYSTHLGLNSASLSYGQRQRIGVARALYGDPFLVVLDEPNSNLDAAGEDALRNAIASVSARGGITVVIAHRSAILVQASHILMLRNGQMEMFGPRSSVLQRIQAVTTAPPPAKGPVRGEMAA